jgi:hypothetical protein
MARGAGTARAGVGTPDRSQSDAVGVVLLVALVLVAGGAFALWAFTFTDLDGLEGATTAASVDVSYENGSIEITHRAGDAVRIDDTTVGLESGARSTKVPLSAFEEASGDGDGVLEAGETFRYGYVPDGRRVAVLLIDEPGNAVLAELSTWIGPTLQLSLSASPASGTAPVSVAFTASASGGSGSPSRIDFSGRSFGSYGGSQDVDGNQSVVQDGYGVGVYGDSWRRTPFEYTVTSDTVLRFQFKSDDAGEIQGIGLDEDVDNSADRVFKLHGTQTGWGIDDFDGHYVTGSGWQTYEIPVGQYYTGEMEYLAFVADGDDDEGSATFRDVRVYENDSDPGYTYAWSIESLGTATGDRVDHTFVSGGEYEASVTVTDPAGNSHSRKTTVTVGSMPNPMDFSSKTIESFGSQDKAGGYSIADGGTTLVVSGNAWKRVDLGTTCQVTADTVLAFEFNSTREGEIHAVGFDDDLDESAGRMFKLFGTQSWGIRAYDTYRTEDGWRGYLVPVGQYYTGSFQHLVVATDDDGDANGVSRLHNVAIYERNGGNTTRTCTP